MGLGVLLNKQEVTKVVSLGRNGKQEGQDGLGLLTWVEDPRDSWGEAIFYPRAVIWTSHLDTLNEVSSLAFWFKRRSSK